MPKISFFGLLLFLLCTTKGAVLGQQTNDIVIQDTVSTDTTQLRRNTFKVIFNGKPGKAALYGLVLPSAGQIYNKKWWKVPLALGIDGWFTYKYLGHRSDFKYYDGIYKNYLKGIPHEISRADAQTFRESSRRNKEYGLVYLIIGHLVTVFDAYVDRHLMDFDATEDVSQIPYQNYDNTITLVKFRIPLN